MQIEVYDGAHTNRIGERCSGNSTVLSCVTKLIIHNHIL